MAMVGLTKLLPTCLFFGHIAAVLGGGAWKIRRDTAARLRVTGVKEGPVTDLREIPFSKLSYDSNHVLDPDYTTPPWERRDVSPNFKAYRSPAVTAHMTKILDQTVEGLDKTFIEVFRIIRNSGCLTYILGGEVRDSILGLESMDTDIAFTCTADYIAQICEKNGWQYQHRPGSTYISIGSPEAHDEGLEGKDAYTSLVSPNHDHEYACNTLFYDWDNAAVLDPTGVGAQDVLNGVARIPGTPEQFDKWAEQHKWNKLLRLWKLRIPPKNFNVSESSFFYVLSELKVLMANGHAELLREGTSHFFKAYASRAQQFAKQMRIDLGSTWFDTYIAPQIPSSIGIGAAEDGQLFTAAHCDSQSVCTTKWVEVPSKVVV